MKKYYNYLQAKDAPQSLHLLPEAIMLECREHPNRMQLIDGKGKFCVECGHVLVESAPPLLCQYCGAEIRDLHKFCGGCGLPRGIALPTQVKTA